MRPPCLFFSVLHKCCVAANSNGCFCVNIVWHFCFIVEIVFHAAVVVFQAHGRACYPLHIAAFQRCRTMEISLECLQITVWPWAFRLESNFIVVACMRVFVCRFHAVFAGCGHLAHWIAGGDYRTLVVCQVHTLALLGLRYCSCPCGRLCCLLDFSPFVSFLLQLWPLCRSVFYLVMNCLWTPCKPACAQLLQSSLHQVCCVLLHWHATHVVWLFAGLFVLVSCGSGVHDSSFTTPVRSVGGHCMFSVA